MKLSELISTIENEIPNWLTIDHVVWSSVAINGEIKYYSCDIDLVPEKKYRLFFPPINFQFNKINTVEEVSKLIIDMKQLIKMSIDKFLKRKEEFKSYIDLCNKFETETEGKGQKELVIEYFKDTEEFLKVINNPFYGKNS